MTELSTLSSRLTDEYRSRNKSLMSVMRKNLETPNSDLARETHYLTGFMDGLKQALSFIAEAQNDNQFNF